MSRRRSACPAGRGCALRTGQPGVAADSLCDRPTLSSSTRPSTASWSRCGTRRKSISGCWPALVERGSGAVQLTDAVRFCAREGAALAGGKPTITPARRAKKRTFRSVQYPCPRAAITRCPAAERCRSGWFRPVLKKKHRVVHKKDLKNQADYAKINSICPALRLRCRQPGDRFRPAGRGTDRELRKWMNEAGIPPRERDTLPLLAAGRQVLWVCGEGFADGLAPGPDTGQLLQVKLENFGGIES